VIVSHAMLRVTGETASPTSRRNAPRGRPATCRTPGALRTHAMAFKISTTAVCLFLSVDQARHLSQAAPEARRRGARCSTISGSWSKTSGGAPASTHACWRAARTEDRREAPDRSGRRLGRHRQRTAGSAVFRHRGRPAELLAGWLDRRSKPCASVLQGALTGGGRSLSPGGSCAWRTGQWHARHSPRALLLRLPDRPRRQQCRGRLLPRSMSRRCFRFERPAGDGEFQGQLMGLPLLHARIR
jgi:hypothetical protein